MVEKAEWPISAITFDKLIQPARRKRVATFAVQVLRRTALRLTTRRIIMFRKSVLLLSLVVLAALIGWGFAPGGSTPACASASSATNCTLQVTVNRPAFVGTAQNPQTASVTWTVTNL